MAFPPIRNTREMADYIRETFIWHWMSTSRLPHPLPEDFNVLCAYFSLAEAEAAAVEFELLEIVQATLYDMLLNETYDMLLNETYDMLLNETFELDPAHEYTAERMKSSLVGLRWPTFKV